MRVEIWRTMMKDEVRAEEMARLQAGLEARAADASKGAALRQLRAIMVRIMKGESAMRLEMWRTAVKMDAYAKHAELAAALEAQMRAQGQGAGLRMLKQIMVRMVKGEAGLRVEIWRTAMKDAQRVAEMARLQSELEARAADALSLPQSPAGGSVLASPPARGASKAASKGWRATLTIEQQIRAEQLRGVSYDRHAWRRTLAEPVR